MGVSSMIVVILLLTLLTIISDRSLIPTLDDEANPKAHGPQSLGDRTQDKPEPLAAGRLQLQVTEAREVLPSKHQITTAKTQHLKAVLGSGRPQGKELSRRL